MTSVSAENETTKSKRVRDKRQKRKMTGKWAGETSVFMEHVYVPGTELGVYMVTPDTVPQGGTIGL